MFDTIAREETITARKLAELRKKSHIPPQLVELVGQVQAVQTRERGQARLPQVDPSRLASVDQVIQGAALLPRQYFVFDAEQAARLFQTFAGMLTQAGGPMAQAAALALEGGAALRDQAFAAFLAGDEEVFAAFARQAPNAPRALNFLAQSSLTPSLSALAESLAKTLPERTWEQATCPVCGSFALHSSLVGKEGARVHCCSFCRANYRTVRLQCPYCQERDAGKMPFFTADEEPGFRLETCETCNGYIKTTDFREFERASYLPLDDLESMALDLLAAKRGLSRPTASAWGF